MLYARHRTVKTSDYFNLSISSAAFLLFFYHFCIRIHNTYTYCIRMTWCIQVILGTCIMNIKYKLYFNCGNDTKHTAGSFRRLSVCDRYTSRQNTHSFFLFIRSVSCSLCVRTRTRICEGLCMCVCVYVKEMRRTIIVKYGFIIWAELPLLTVLPSTPSSKHACTSPTAAHKQNSYHYNSCVCITIVHYI